MKLHILYLLVIYVHKEFDEAKLQFEKCMRISPHKFKNNYSLITALETLKDLMNQNII